jgi:hypothetical protein
MRLTESAHGFDLSGSVDRFFLKLMLPTTTFFEGGRFAALAWCAFRAQIGQRVQDNLLEETDRCAGGISGRIDARGLWFFRAESRGDHRLR